MITKFEFKGTGGELFKQLFVGLLLCSVTFGIYYPWFLVALHKMILEKTIVRVGDRELRPTFKGTGGQLFKHLFVGYLFTIWSFGIYLPWLVVRLIKFQQENLVVADDETNYGLSTRLTGGELFKELFVGYLLCAVTFGIYFPWFFVKLMKTILENTEIRADDRAIGMIGFNLTGGAFFKEFIVGYLLTAVTMGVYIFWFQVQVLRLYAVSTEIEIDQRRYRGDFTGTGGENFNVNFVGYLLTVFTFGIYGFWYIANLIRFQLSNMRFVPVDGIDDAPPTPRVSSRSRAGNDTRPRQIAVRPASAPVPSAPAVSARAPVDGDRRAAWARAFLPPEAEDHQEEPLLEQPQEWATLQEKFSAHDVWTDKLAARSPDQQN